jgi:hypothetical protein
MSAAAIRAALESKLATWAASRSPPIPVAWQNVAFTPPAQARYLRAFLLPAATISRDLQGAHRGYIGIFQINVIVPIGTGPGAAEAIADALALEFPAALRIGTAPVVLLISPAAVGAALQGDDTFTVPVSITYRADTI